MTVSAAKTAATEVSGDYTVNVSLGKPNPYDSMNDTNDVACGVFADIMDNKVDMRIFADRVIASGKTQQVIYEEAVQTIRLLQELARVQGVPIPQLLEQMYPAMCSHIKA